ncbi:MAG: hypothetical protein WBA98_03760 [Gordonia sp. (in: high G+C Gram-positive bacteria)]|uniref:hypothetical protein n=1 Tax=Gordonia sp. (in: high G+C Gram-positive bacteria) TaxID=84139 RepID=UPI003C730547
MSAMKEYRIPAPGGEFLTVQLSDEDAARYGDKATPVGTKAKAPANKSKAPANKESGE